MTVIDMAENFLPALGPNILHDQLEILETLHFAEITALNLVDAESIIRLDRLRYYLLFFAV